jgi:hypothetical protein
MTARVGFLVAAAGVDERAARQPKPERLQLVVEHLRQLFEVVGR